MAKRQNIVKYRERLDKTLTSFDLTNDEKLKTLVKSQLHRSSQLEMELEGYKEKLEIKTAELSNFLNMIRSASADESGGSNTSHTDWKLKQDTEEFRVMYHEGPEGTPFHTLLVEGYVDGPVDVCLGLSWEASLYKKWWPQFTVPTFKVTVSECLQKVQTGEQISLVRVKPPWPVSTREAIVHFYMFEYYQDDLVVVLMKSVPESKRINEVIDGFNTDVIPGEKGVVRMDLVGGFVLQKVTSERSYFRTIANLDIKIDFMPPSLINFISRQLIGSGFRLYQKAVASKMNKDREFSKALTDPLYVRIREALYNIDEEKEELKQYASILPVEELSQSKQDAAKDVSREDRSNQCTNNYNGEILDAGSEEIVQGEEGDTFIVLKGNRNCEIVDAESEEIVEANIEEIVVTESEEIVQIEKYGKKINDIPIEEANIEEIVQIEKYNDTRGIMKGKSNVYISSNVKQALETLERAISVVRKYGFHSRRFSFRFVHEETRCTEKSGEVDPYSANPVHPFVKKDVSVKGPSGNVVQESSEDFYEIQNIRHTGPDPNLKELNYNKVVPAFRNQNLIEANQVDSHSVKNGTTQDHTICYDSKQYRGRDMRSDDPIKSSRQRKINNLVTQGISSDVPKQLSKRKNYRYCCFMP